MLHVIDLARRNKELKKEDNGSLRLFVTIPANLADSAIELYNNGYDQNDWAKEGIRLIKRRESGVVL